MDQARDTQRIIFICALLSAVTLVTFWPVVHCEFVLYDDPYYVSANPHVATGLRLENIAWAFRNGDFANWFPLTWISHMMDVEMFGSNAGGHHLTNVAYHIANTILLLWVLHRMTGAVWPCAFVAGLFALHPLHVGSVAWVAERKDMLSTFFGLLSLWAYTAYVTHSKANQSRVLSPESRVGGVEASSVLKSESRITNHASPAKYYLLSLLFFALGLMSKPMLVTWPFLLLLLDYWPLGRFNPFAGQGAEAKSGWQGVSKLLLEKVPFFALTVLMSLVTLFVQVKGGTTSMWKHVPFGARLGNAFISYLRYIGKMFWPENLAVMYPHPGSWPIWQVLIAALVVLGISLWALWVARQRPYVPVGWFWFLGTLVPVIGLVQVGEQAIADRYTYVPLIGLFILVAWAGASIAPRWQHRNIAYAAVACLCLSLLALGSRSQLPYWQNSIDLFEHSIKVAGGSPVIHNNLGVARGMRGEWAEAERQALLALQLDPASDMARANLVVALAQQGKTQEAINQVAGMTPEWEANARGRLAQVFLEQLKVSEAADQYAAAVRLFPNEVASREKLALALSQLGKTAEASEQYAAIVRLRPDAQAHYRLGVSLAMLGQPQPAIEHFKEALRLNPDWPEAMNELAWLLATAPKAELRDGPEALRLAERAYELSGRKEAKYLGTLDAAHAEAGHLTEAIAFAEETHRQALATGNQQLADAATARLEVYRAGKAYHQP